MASSLPVMAATEDTPSTGLLETMGSVNLAGLAIIGGLTLAISGLGVVFVKNRRRAGLQSRSGSAEVIKLRAALDRAESMIAAQNTVNIVWDGEDADVFGNPALIDGLPETEAGIAAYHGWLEIADAEILAKRLETLQETGEAFALDLVTKTGAPLVAEGLTTGGRALLSLRSASKTEQKNATLSHRCSVLEREVEASRALLSKIPAPVWISNPENNLDWVNPAYAAIVGAEDQQDAISASRSLFATDIQDRISQATSEDQSFADTVPIEISGRALAYDVLAVPFSRGVIGLARDTSERDALRNNLGRLVEVYARTMDQVETAVASFDADGNLEFFNSSFVRLWGLDKAWLQKKPHLGAIYDRLWEDGRLPEPDNYRKWKKEQLEPNDHHESQEQLWHLPSGQSVRILAGRHPYGTIYLYDDVSGQLKLENQNNTLSNIQRETIDNLQEGAALFSSSGKLQLFNPAFARIWDIAPDKLEGEPHIERIVGWAHDLHEDRAFWSGLRGTITTLGEVRKTFEARIERPDGSVFDCKAVPLPGGSTLVTFSDVTDSFRAEQALKDRNRALEEADQIKSRFVQHVSYILRAPLNTIIGYADLLALPVSGKLNQQQGEYTDHIQTATNALLAIVDDILDLATIDAGSMELDLSSADPESVMAAAAAGVQDRFQQAGVGLKIEAPEGDISFTADRKRVQQVLFNLLANAVEHSTKGDEVLIRCALEEGFLTFSVTDQGPGIAPRAMSMIFQKFETYPSGQGHRGPGLGLAIVKDLVELHGGEVMVNSVPGKGATFTCKFPLTQKDPGTAG
ncbi:MAG: PAS-domain containing protein [Rhizobiales bacterium]|nr:PAS-domain containing protein [Hyphomicrobiales bacterium]